MIRKKTILCIGLMFGMSCACSAQSTTTTMTTQQFNEVQCLQITEEERRLEIEYAQKKQDIQRKKDKLAEDVVTVQVSNINAEIAKLQYEKEKEIAAINLRYANQIAELQSKVQILITMRKNSCK